MADIDIYGDESDVRTASGCSPSLQYMLSFFSIVQIYGDLDESKPTPSSNDQSNSTNNTSVSSGVDQKVS